mmetsp:Transcript_9754/g.25052  ORF Transcript_9754/g.25052 Transcript_9754/m.25052 type:complete len:240 (-) Transcript_9754:594-1313(-)
MVLPLSCLGSCLLFSRQQRRCGILVVPCSHVVEVGEFLVQATGSPLELRCELPPARLCLDLWPPGLHLQQPGQGQHGPFGLRFDLENLFARPHFLRQPRVHVLLTKGRCPASAAMAMPAITIPPDQLRHQPCVVQPGALVLRLRVKGLLHQLQLFIEDPQGQPYPLHPTLRRSPSRRRSHCRSAGAAAGAIAIVGTIVARHERLEGDHLVDLWEEGGPVVPRRVVGEVLKDLIGGEGKL